MKTIRLSEAIRLGSMMKPQAFGDLTSVVIHRSNGPLGLVTEVQASCAMQAAYEAGGIPVRKTVLEKGSVVTLRNGLTRTVKDDEVGTVTAVSQEWYDLMMTGRACQECAIGLPLYHLVPHLNDVHRWTRERIADFVETIEKQQEVSSEPLCAERELAGHE